LILLFGNGKALCSQIMVKGLHNPFSINRALLQPKPQIKKVATFVALIEGTHFGAKKLLQGIGSDVAASAEPGRLNSQDMNGRRIHMKMVAGIDLKLQP